MQSVQDGVLLGLVVHCYAFYLTRQLIGEYVGLEPIGLDLWQLYFGEPKLGLVDERLKSVIRPK